MGGNYPPVNNNVINQTFTPEEASFGIPVILDFVSGGIATLWAALDTPFTLEVSPNNYKSNMAAIGFTAADSHWKHVATMFAQTGAQRRVTKAILGRRVAAAAKVIRVTVGEAVDGDYSIQYETDDPQVYAAAAKTAGQIATALALLFAASTTVSAVVADTNKIDFTSLLVGFDFALTLDSPTGLLTQAVTTPNTGAGDDLTVIRAENPDWFDIFEGSHSTATILEVAKFAEGNVAHFWAESNAAAVKANTAGNVAALLKAKAYKDTSIRYHHTGSELFSAALGGRVLAYGPGQVQISHRKLVGITKKNYSAEAGVTSAFSTNNVGYYDSAGGGVTLYNYCSGGSFIELERNKYIIESRLDNKMYGLLSDNDITAYTTKEGVASVKAKVQEGLNEFATEGGTGYIIRETIVINTTPIEGQPTENQAKLKIGGVDWYANVRIGTNEIETNGSLSIV